LVEPPPIQVRTRSTAPRATWVQIALIVGTALIIPIVLGAVIVAHGGIKDPGKFGEGLGQVACCYFGISIISLIVWGATRSRTLWPTVITFSALMFVYAAISSVVLIEVLHRAERAQLWRDLERVNQQMFAEIKRITETDGAAVDLDAIIAAHSAQLNKIAGTLGGEDAIIANVGARVIQDLGRSVGAYLRALKPVNDAGGLDAKTLKDRAAVTKRRDLLRPAIKAHDSVVELLGGMPGTIRARAREFGADERLSQTIVSSMTKGMHLTELIRLHRMEHDLLRVMDEHLADLQRAWPHWSVSNGKFLFDSEYSQERLDAFNQRVRKLESLAAEQSQAQADLLNAAAGGNR